MTDRIVVPAVALFSSVVAACAALGARDEGPPAPATRTYYVAADEVVWDYVPSGIDKITGHDFDEYAKLILESGPDRIGKVYKKAIYRAYTDDTFTELIPRAPEWEHLGMLGPLLRAAVGDTIVVVFRNNSSFPASLHPHGVFYTKDSEGAPSEDGTGDGEKADDGVPPGGTHTYVWPVPERAGPAEGDPSSILWMYHSHVDEDADVNSGLMAPMIVTRRRDARADLTPRDVDRELIVSFHEIDENVSHYLEENLWTYTTEKRTASPEERAFFHPFGFSNFMESMNGFLFGNLPGLTVREGERVRWYLMANTNFEVHAPHWHGNTVVLNHMRTDVTSLLTMGMQVADMVPDNPGKWLFHCHVKDHLKAGMQAHYTVLPQGDKTANRNDDG
ncbi:MAG: multicopper oxidase domain-containing protein [Gemmatimonadales bacterium]